MAKSPSVTPWGVSGRVDYDALISKFGTRRLDDALLGRLRTAAGGELHVALRRGVFFSHMDLDLVLDDWQSGGSFYLYTGRAPSLGMHIGHLIPFMVTKWFQDKFGANVYVEVTDDEKFLRHPEYKLEDTTKWAYDNILDIAAVGFNPDKTFIFQDTEYMGNMYPLILEIARRINFSEASATFGLRTSSNIGLVFYPAIQIAPTMFEHRRCLIPAGIDQEPYWRLQRDIAEGMGYYKAAQIHGRFLPPLTGPEGKMSSSIPESAVYLSDDPKTVERKVIRHAFSGGQPTAELHRKYGANLDVDVAYQWLYYLFEEDDSEIRRIAEDYSSGKMLTGEVKTLLVEKLNSFLEAHRERRERARELVQVYKYTGALAKEMWANNPSG
ncbi:MAG: tryptophan--tRNA ligase [Thermoprotei archaeon]